MSEATEQPTADRPRAVSQRGSDAFNAFITVSSSPVPGDRAIAVKDNIDVRGFPTTAGSALLPLDRPVAADAPVVSRLRAAGYVVAGKTNMHELALGATGTNPTYGDVLNPVDPSRLPGGSSSGSAAAVASGAVSVALGTDTGGSIRVPAALTGIVGFRPTPGRYPRGGVVPLSPSRDVVGPMGRTMTDVLGVDLALTTGSRRSPVPSAPDRPRLGVPDRHFVDDLDETTQTTWEDTLRVLDHAGVALVELEATGLDVTEEEVGRVITFFEARAALVPYLVEHTGAEDLTRLVAGIASDDVRELVAARVVPGGAHAVTPAEYAAARTAVAALRARYAEAFAEHSLHGIIFPTTPAVAGRRRGGTEGSPEHGANDAFASIIRNTVPGSLAGVPGVSVPAPSPGLPVGIAVDGAAGQDRLVLALGLMLETMLDKEGAR